MKKIILPLLLFLSFFIPQSIFAQEVPCNPTGNICGGQTAYDTCTPTCSGSNASYYCYQASNPNCNGTLLCGSENSRCQSSTPVPTQPSQPTTPVATDCNAQTPVCNQKIYDHYSFSCDNNGHAKYFSYQTNNPNCQGTILCPAEDSKCTSSTPLQPSNTETPMPTSSINPTTNPTATVIRTDTPTQTPVTVTNVTTEINGQKLVLNVNNPLNIHLPITDLTKESDVPIKIDATYSDGTTKDFYLTFHYKVKQSADTSGVTHLTSCQEITKPGNYVLDGDLTGAKEAICINIHDTSNINLDCNNHSIQSDGYENVDTHINGIYSSMTIGTILVNKVNEFTIQSCGVLPSNRSSMSDQIGILSSSNGLISNNQIDTHAVFIQGSKNIEFKNNSLIRGWLFNNFSTNTLIEKNNFTIPSNTPNKNNGYVPYFVQSGVSSNTKVLNNTMIGNGDTKEQNGVDDGIAILQDSNVIVENNSISNVWDCGIETVGKIENSRFNNNSIKNTGFCGIGGWFDSSWLNNTISNNTADNTPQLFDFHWQSVRQQSEIPVNELDYFKDNKFTNNTLVNQKKSVKYPHPVYLFFQQESQGAKGKFVLENNTFTNNNFGKDSWPYFYPNSMIVDGGGNTCQQYPDKDFPLKCVGETPSQVQRLQQIIPPSVIPEPVELPSNLSSPHTPSQTPQPTPTVAPPPLKLIDFNNDGVINIFDYIIFAQKKLGS